MTLNGVMAVTLLYFNEFGKPAIQLLTTCLSIELIDQKLASTCITHRTVKLVCVTKFSIRGWTQSYRYVTFNLSSKLHFTPQKLFRYLKLKSCLETINYCINRAMHNIFGVDDAASMLFSKNSLIAKE